MRRTFTKQFKNEVLDRIKRGETRVSVSKAMRVGLNTITKWTQEAGLSSFSTKQSYSKEFIYRVLSDIRSGMSVREASGKHNVSATSITRWLTEDNLAKRVVTTPIVPTTVKTEKTEKGAMELILDDSLYSNRQVLLAITEDGKLKCRIWR